MQDGLITVSGGHHHSGGYHQSGMVPLTWGDARANTSSGLSSSSLHCSSVNFSRFLIPGNGRR
jgi:hypothetical protein